jgi:hypothetical protein
MTPPNYRQSSKHMVDSRPSYPFTGHFPQEPPWRLRGIRRVLGIAALVFSKQTTCDCNPRARISFVFPEWYISAVGKT